MPDDVQSAIQQNAQGPSMARGDSGEVRQHPITHQIEAAPASLRSAVTGDRQTAVVGFLGRLLGGVKKHSPTRRLQGPRVAGRMGGMILLVLNSVAASLTGVLMPGPMTAATLAAAVHRPHAGAMIALGHAVVEVPLILVLMKVSGLLNSVRAQIALGLVGGAYLAWLGVTGLWGLRKPLAIQARPVGRHPFVVGIVLSGGNPLFLFWWGTAGLLIANSLMRVGWVALALFAVIHWLCDLVWLEGLSVATFRGTRLLGERWHKAILGLCAGAILFFAGWYLHDAGAHLLKGSAR